MNRPDDLPPSQGGKYSGFGSSPFEPENNESDGLLEDPIASLSKGWSVFSSFAMKGAKLAVAGAENLGKSVASNVIAPTTATIRDPHFNQNVSSYVSSLTQKVFVALFAIYI